MSRVHHHRVHHVSNIPDKGAHPVRYRILQARWKLAIMAVMYPVQIAAFIALAICSVPVYLLLQQSAELKHQQATQHHIVSEIQTSRLRATSDICHQLDANTRLGNAQLLLFENIIVSSVKQSRPFGAVYRKLNLPPYNTRLRQALKTAGKIDALKLPLPNCKRALYFARPRG